jgi:hypothetical protein
MFILEDVVVTFDRVFDLAAIDDDADIPRSCGIFVNLSSRFFVLGMLAAFSSSSFPSLINSSMIYSDG